jgi:hypothetical protein
VDVTQRPREPAVVVPPLRRGQHPVRDLTQLVMTEVVGVASTGQQHLPPPQLVEVPGGPLLARPDQHVHRDGRSGRGGQAGQLAGAGRQLEQPRLQDRLHHRREHLRVAAAPAGPQCLHDKQRVAVGLGVQPIGVHSVQSGIQPAGQRGGLGAVQPARGQLGAAAEGPQAGEQRVQRVLGIGLGEPGRRGDQQRRLPVGAQQVVQELQRGCVGGVQVVGDQQHRAGARVQGVHHRVEELQP